MIGKAAFFIPFLASIAIALEADFAGAAAGLERGTAIGAVFLVGNEGRAVIQFQTCRAEMIGKLIAQRRRWRGKKPAADGRCLDQRDALNVIHDMQRFTGARDGAGGIVFPVEFEATQIKPLVLGRAILPLGDLAHALATGIVDIVGRFRRAAASDLTGTRRQLVLLVPAHQWQMRHADHIAMRVMAIRLDRCRRAGLQRRLAQPVALPAELGLAVLVISVGPCPVTAGCLMCKSQEVADRIVGIDLGIVPQRLQIVRLAGAGGWIITIVAVARRKREAGLSAVLAALCRGQPIQRIVNIVANGIDLLIGIEHRL